MGGARKGQEGDGRVAIEAAQAARRETITPGEACPYCTGPLEARGFRSLSVPDMPPPQRIVYQLERKNCPRCRKFIQARAPAVLHKSLFGNQLTTQAVFLHYRHGAPRGQVCEQSGIGLGGGLALLHCVASRLKRLEYRQAPVHDAAETSWRNDGRCGCDRLFAMLTLSVLRPSPGDPELECGAEP